MKGLNYKICIWILLNNNTGSIQSLLVCTTSVKNLVHFEQFIGTVRAICKICVNMNIRADMSALPQIRVKNIIKCPVRD